MTKAERRKRARQRAKERERQAVTVEQTSAEPSGVTSAPSADSAEVAATFAELEPAVHQEAPTTESDFITGPVRPKPPGPARTVRPELARGAPITEASLSGVESDEDEEDDEDEDEDGEGDDGDDDGELDEQDALFNLACAAVEEGDNLTWAELVTWLVAAEVEDPRLATLVSLVTPETEESNAVPKLTGDRVLEVLETIGLEELVAEARETVAAAPKEEPSDEERQLVRTTARELNAQAKRQLGGDRPVKASALRAAGRGER